MMRSGEYSRISFSSAFNTRPLLIQPPKFRRITLLPHSTNSF
ncbi:hypothetical protein [Rubritalea tangerina]